MGLFHQSNIEDVGREINIMSITNHENLLNFYVSFVDKTDIWIVMPLILGGSLEGIIKHHFKDGISDEKILANILK